MIYTNYLLAQQKLVYKQRNGAKVQERYGRAATPFARTSQRKSIFRECRHVLTKTMADIRPGELYRQICVLTSRLEHMALAKAPALAKPLVNRAFNSPV